MASLHDTAYPRLRSQLTVRELTEIYSPTRDELTLAQQATRGASSQVAFLVLLKTFQRLGYFVSLPTVPRSIVAHIASCAGILFAFVDLVRYDNSGTRRRHLALIRTHLGVQPYGPPARRLLLHVMEEAARTKDEVADLINIAIEELVRHRWELPTFITLQRAARHVRALVARRYYRAIAAAVSPAVQDQLHLIVGRRADPTVALERPQTRSWQRHPRAFPHALGPLSGTRGTVCDSPGRRGAGATGEAAPLCG